jgi:hypothetical protein
MFASYEIFAVPGDRIHACLIVSTPGLKEKKKKRALEG